MQCSLMSARTANHRSSTQSGAALVVVLLILVIASILGIGASQIAIMAERSSRNDRDEQLARHAAEAALLDAESDIAGRADTRSRADDLRRSAKSDLFVSGCGNGDSSRNVGLCAMVASGKPAWLTVDFARTDGAARTAAFGLYTGAAYPAGGTGSNGIQSSKAPRYVIEAIPDEGRNLDLSELPQRYVYRITAMGFGPRDDIQAVAQSIYRN